MADGLGALSQVSGLSREEVHRIAEEVKANLARLEGCPGPHRFPPLEAKLGANYTCATCGGRVNAVARSWYDRGLADGRANPE